MSMPVIQNTAVLYDAFWNTVGSGTVGARCGLK
jgi:hypothetical protein